MKRKNPPSEASKPGLSPETSSWAKLRRLASVLAQRQERRDELSLSIGNRATKAFEESLRDALGEPILHLSYCPDHRMSRKGLAGYFRRALSALLLANGGRRLDWVLVYEQRTRTGENRLHIHALIGGATKLPEGWSDCLDPYCRFVGADDGVWAYVARKLTRGEDFELSPGLDLFGRQGKLGLG